MNALHSNNVTFSSSVFDNTQLAYGEDITLTSDNLSTYKIAKEGKVTIPSIIKSSDGMSHKVTQIGDGAFENCSKLTSITIQYGVTSIGNNAFNRCSGLASIIYDGESFTNKTNLTNAMKHYYGVKIGTNVFDGTKLN